MKKLVYLLAVLVWTGSVKAQDGGLNFSVGADVVSSYVWRGVVSDGGAAFQPAASLSIGNFALSAWASTEITGLHKEVDFTVGYSVGGLSLAVTDYWWEGEGVFKYLNYGKETAHLWEGSLGYTLPVKSFPLSFSVNTMFAGADKKSKYEEMKEGEEDKSNFSTYIEASLPFTIKDVNLSANLGATTGKGIYAEKATGVSMVNVSLKASKEIKITDSFSLPVFGQIILNPHQEDIFFVFGFSL